MLARDAQRRVPKLDYVSPGQCFEVLSPLRGVFSQFALYGLTVGNDDHRPELYKFAEHAAHSSGRHGLFLLPDLPAPSATLELLDPLPHASEIVRRPDLWPAILYWTPSGSVALVGLNDADRIYREIQKVEFDPPSVDRILADYRKSSETEAPRRLLHLSDLHFGNKYATQRQQFLLAHIKNLKGQIDRVVITGDLFDTPDDNAQQAFEAFRGALDLLMEEPCIVIPGNHDVKNKGNSYMGFGTRTKQLAKLEWSGVVVDDHMQCVFFCFDSSTAAKDFARGLVTDQQLLEVGTRFSTLAAREPRIRDYLSVALIHHHPYSFETAANTMLQRVLSFFGTSDEKFLRLENADVFLDWCAGNRIPLVLHGHKHVPRHITENIAWTKTMDTGSREVTAVGCGTSLGAEGAHQRFDILEWSPMAKRWWVSFWVSAGAGVQFDEELIALHPVVR